MTLKTITEAAAEMLGIEDNNILFRCANLVVANIATNYIDCMGRQTFNVTDGKIEFSQFSRTVLHVKSAEKNGQPVKFDLYVNFITVPNGVITVDYAFVPKFASTNDLVTAVAGIANEAILLYGILTEYATVSGLADDAKTYGARFEKLIAGMIRNGHARRLTCNY